MRLIGREALKDKLERGDTFKLYMTLGRQAYDFSHIPGSIHLDNIDELVASLPRDTEIVVYCANPACPSSTLMYVKLRNLGFTNLYRYAGGVEDWYAAGYPLEGEIESVRQIA